ncbi:MAG: B12-binding domain-containing radical SAM protein [Myxococcota bacterium]
MRALLINVGHGADTADRHPRHHVAPVDLAQAAAILEQAGWVVDLWDTALEPHADPAAIAARARAKAPDLLVARPLHHTAATTDRLLRTAAAPDTLRLAMGPSAAHLADRLLTCPNGLAPANGVLVGEPEGTLMDLLPHLADGSLPEELPGLQLRRGQPPKPRAFLRDLDALPLPSHHLLVGRGYRFRYPLDVDGPLRMGYVLTSRGCALQCVFCAPSERETFGTQYRWRSADHIVDELEVLRDLGANAVYFIDDFFGFSKGRIRDLCEAMLRRGAVLPWVAQVRAQGLDLELLKLMRRAGCSTLCFGAESGSDRVLRILKKGITTAQLREQARLIHEAGIQLVAYFIVGVPGETDAERAATYELIREIRPDLVQIHIFNLFPGSSAMELYPELYSPTGSKFTGPATMGPELERLDRERRAFYLRYYLDPRNLGRMVRRRWRPILANLGDEVDFAWQATRYFMRNR